MTNESHPILVALTVLLGAEVVGPHPVSGHAVLRAVRHSVDGGLIYLLSSGLQYQYGELTVLGQSVGQSASCRSSAD